VPGRVGGEGRGGVGPPLLVCITLRPSLAWETKWMEQKRDKYENKTKKWNLWKIVKNKKEFFFLFENRNRQKCKLNCAVAGLSVFLIE
jgi:hypothetical protein